MAKKMVSRKTTTRTDKANRLLTAAQQLPWANRRLTFLDRLSPAQRKELDGLIDWLAAGNGRRDRPSAKDLVVLIKRELGLRISVNTFRAYVYRRRHELEK